MELNLAVYIPTAFLLPGKREKYESKGKGISRLGRETGMQKLMCINLLKRLESSANSFNKTLKRVKSKIEETIKEINDYRNGKLGVVSVGEIDENEFDFDDINSNLFDGAVKTRDIDIADIDYISWLEKLTEDLEILEVLISLISEITPEHDLKLQTLIDLIADKLKTPINEGNKKTLIFTAFADTAEYLYDNLAPFFKDNYGLNSALVTGSIDGRATLKLKKTDMNTVLTLFSPISKEKELLMPGNTGEIDILIGTDCISEGQNLQDCDCCVNYDIHWNPVRIIQRFGRIDRIGSINEKIKLVNFWPNVALDKYLSLTGRVETRMKASVMTSTGDDNLLSPEEKGDLEYRAAQLKKLKKEVVDLEEMGAGVSIMDLGLNEFRLDLLDYVSEHGGFETTPNGLHAVVPSAEGLPPGAVFVLKNRNTNIDAKNQNRIHPFYMVYVRDNGNKKPDILIDHLHPKKMLDSLRILCAGKTSPIPTLYNKFNKETKDGKDMKKISRLLSCAVKSIIDNNEETDIESLFRKGGTTSLINKITGIDDFELICFIVVKDIDNV